jgi:hypothetical protein
MSFAQVDYQEVVYLKNGNVIRGVIIEQIPNIQLKIETAEGNVFVFQMNEIEKITKEKISKVKRPEHPFMLSLQGGGAYSYLDLSGIKQTFIQNYGLTSKEAGDYVDGLKRGLFLGANFHYLFTDFLGLGVDYNFFHSSTKGEFLVNGNYGYGNSLPVYVKVNNDERIYLHFIAPSVVFMQYFDRNKKIRLTESFAPGFVNMRWESRSNAYQFYWGDNDFYLGNPPMYYDSSNSVITGGNFSAKIGLSVEYCFNSNWSMGLTGSFIWAKIKKAQYKSIDGENSGELNEALNFSHLDYGIKVCYNF